VFVERTHFTEFFEAVKEAGFDGADRAAEGGGDAFQRFLGVEAEVNNIPLFARQELQAAHEFMGALAFFRATVGASLGGGNVNENGLGALAFAGPKEGERDGSSPAEQAAVAMEKDAAKPGEEAALAIVAGEAFPSFEKGLLDEIFGGGGIAAEGGGLPQERARMGTAQLAEGRGVP
jgi:hypothetical protein